MDSLTTVFTTVTDMIRRHAAQHPDRPALTHLRASGRRPEVLTYGDLDRRARGIAARLARETVAGPGERILLAHPPGPGFAAAFAGCLYAGMVPVPAPLPGEVRRDTVRLAALIEDADIRLALTDRSAQPELAMWLSTSGFGHIGCLAADTPGFDEAHAWTPPPAAAPEDPAFLLYTSGATGRPRGVLVSHGNAAAGQRALQQLLGTDSRSVLGGWLPPYHDLGLAGFLLHTLWLGASSVSLDHTEFVRDPLRWLQMIDTYGVTVSAAPGFAYDLCVRAVGEEELAGLDLSRWSSALVGGEPLSAATLAAFTRHFAPAGLRPEALLPCYGLAEATWLVAGARPGTGPVLRTVDAVALEQGMLRPVPEDAGAYEAGVRTLVGSGIAAGAEVRVVDPHGLAVLPAGSVGEIWVRGAGVADGYWGRPAESHAVFGATTADGETDFVRTGDMGAMAESGELFVLGRMKDVMTLSGRRVHPEDVERTAAEASPLAGPGVAFAVEEQLVLVQEVLHAPADAAALAEELRTHLMRALGVDAANILLARPGTVQRTTSGKARRTLMRQLLLDGRIGARSLHHQVLEPEIAALLPERRRRTWVRDRMPVF